MAEPFSGSGENLKRRLSLEFSYWRDSEARVFLSVEPALPGVTLKFIGFSHCPKGVQFADWERGDWILVRLKMVEGKRHFLATHLRGSKQTEAEKPKHLRTIEMSEDLFLGMVGDLRFSDPSLPGLRGTSRELLRKEWRDIGVPHNHS